MTLHGVLKGACLEQLRLVPLPIKSMGDCGYLGLFVENFVHEAVRWFIPGGLLLKWRACFGECAWMHIRLRTVLAFAVLLVVHVILSVCVVTAVVPDTLPYCSCVQSQRKIKYIAWLLVSTQFINMQDFMYLYKTEEPQKRSLASEQRF